LSLKRIIVYSILFFLIFSPITISLSEVGAQPTFGISAADVRTARQDRLADSKLSYSSVEGHRAHGGQLYAARSELFNRLSFDAPYSSAQPTMIADGLASVPDTGHAVKIVFGEISFAPHSDRLTDVGAGRCQLVLRKFRERKNVRVIVESTSGAMGAHEEDLKLNWRRAEAVQEKLHGLGVPSNRMSSLVLGTDEMHGSENLEWVRSTPVKVEFTIRAGSGS
jgi:outer membrane protein OmpA-like peptidoglycan-associated protein